VQGGSHTTSKVLLGDKTSVDLQVLIYCMYVQYKSFVGKGADLFAGLAGMLSMLLSRPVCGFHLAIFLHPLSCSFYDESPAT
jgi:hypothetical protein